MRSVAFVVGNNRSISVDFVSLAPTKERLREALEQVRDAGLNMLRIPEIGRAHV